jgi:hypothetical protein
LELGSLAAACRESSDLVELGQHLEAAFDYVGLGGALAVPTSFHKR